MHDERYNNCLATDTIVCWFVYIWMYDRYLYNQINLRVHLWKQFSVRYWSVTHDED